MNLKNNTFENKILIGLNNCGVYIPELEKSGQSLGVAVSGGADSVSLLISLSNILVKSEVFLKVISVNHNIRPENETKGDVDFVVSLCDELKKSGKKIKCRVYNIEKGEVQKLAEKNKAGIEEAARVLRYEAFNDFIQKENIAFLCLAHNQNDKLETILMRFIQGAFCDSAAGIPEKRDCFIRPMLDISRKEIEAYLNQHNQSWCTDKTNFDNNYLRNNIRNNLVPLLNSNFNGWQKAVLYGAEKNDMDRKIIDSIVNKINLEKNNGTVSLSRETFNSQMDGVKIRLLLKAANLIDISQRIPFAFLEDVLRAEIETRAEKDYVKTFENLEIEFKKDRVLIKKSLKKTTELFFSDIIEETCKKQFIFGDLTVIQKENNLIFDNGENQIIVNCSLPVRIRNYYAGDEIVSSSGELKKITDIFSDWHVDEDKRYLIPIVEELNNRNKRIVCILGSFQGFKNWVVK